MRPLTTSPEDLTTSSEDPPPPSDSSPAQSGLVEKLGIRVESQGADVTVVSMPVRGNTQPHGILHGGATAALCETAASLAASAHAERLQTRGGAPARVPVGVQLSISHVSPGRAGWVTARTKAVHLGRSSTVHEVTVTDEDGKIVSVALATNQIIDVPPPAERTPDCL